HVGVERRAAANRIDPGAQALLVDVDDKPETETLHGLVSKRDHVPKLPRRIDVKQRKRRLGRMEGLAGQMQEDGGILADRIEQDRPLEIGGHLAQDMDAFRLESIQMIHENSATLKDLAHAMCEQDRRTADRVKEEMMITRLRLRTEGKRGCCGVAARGGKWEGAGLTSLEGEMAGEIIYIDILP